MKIRLLPHHLYKILSAIFILNLLFLIFTWAFHFYYYDVIETKWEEGTVIKHLLKELTLASENSIATWYSSKLFLIVGLMTFVCFWMQKKAAKNKRENILSYGWLVFFFIFTLLSFDEIASMHERLGNVNALNPLGDYPLGWVFLLGIPIVLVAFFMLVFSWMQIRRAPWAVVFAVAGILLFLSIPLQEHFEMQAWHAAADMSTWQRPVLFLLLEEGSEIFGATSMFISTLLFTYYIKNPGKKLFFQRPLKLSMNLHKNESIRWLALICIFLALVVVAIENNPLLAGEEEMGIVINWLPASTAFLVCLLGLYIFHKVKNFPSSYRNTCLLLSVLCLFLSIYFGSNMSKYFTYFEQETVKIIVMVIIFPVTIMLATRYIIDSKDIFRRIGFFVWAVLLLFAFIMENGYAAGTAYVSFSILLITLFSRILAKKRAEPSA